MFHNYFNEFLKKSSGLKSAPGFYGDVLGVSVVSKQVGLQALCTQPSSILKALILSFRKSVCVKYVLGNM